MDAGAAAVFYVVLFGGLLAVGIFLGVSGGIGGIAASMSSKSRRPDPRLSAPVANRVPTLADSPAASSAQGFSRPDMLAAIDAHFNNDFNVASVAMADLVPDVVSPGSLRRQATLVAEKVAQLKKALDTRNDVLREIGDIQENFLEKRIEQAFVTVSFQRALRSMNDSERAALRLTEMLFALGELTARERLQIVVPVVWNQGQCLMTGIDAFGSADRLDAFREAISGIFRGHLGEFRTATERLQEALRKALQPASKVSAADRAVLERYLFGGARWLTPEAGTLVLAPNLPLRPSALRLGVLQGTQEELMFDCNESLITIGPPGTGKSQTLMRNLLTMDGGALVIDIKGELYKATAEWRRQKVGDVYRFAPADLANSIMFNPLDAVRREPEDAYEDAQKLVNLLMVPEDAKGKDFWDKSGLDLLRNAILDVALHEGETDAVRHERALSKVFERLSYDPGGEDVGLTEGSEMDEWARKLLAAGNGDYTNAPVAVLFDQAKSLRTMTSKMRSSIIKTAQIHMGTWRGPRFERLTKRSTFDPLSLRRGKATVYICVTVEELEAYATVLRAFIGQTFYALCRGEPDQDQVVTFFVDEMPKLGRLDILENALDLGRSYGVRTWSFAQYYYQIEKAYQNGEGFLKNALVNMWMGIDDTTAQRLSKEMGQRHGLLDGRRKPLAEPHELSGEEFRDLILARIRNASPAKLEKRFAVADELCAERILPVGTPDEPGILRHSKA